MWTASFGGNGGEPFEILNDNYTVAGVKGRFGDWLDRLAFDFNNLKTGEYETSQEIGGSGGEEFFWLVPFDSELQTLRIWAVPNQFVHGIQFLLQNGTESPLFGQPTGDYAEIHLKGKRIAGFGGRKGGYLDQIRFYLQDKST